MATRFFNGLQIDVPDGWVDLSTVIIAPKRALEDGKKPSINLVVKRRPTTQRDTAQTLRDYLVFMRNAFGALEHVESKEMLVGRIKGQAVRFLAHAEGRAFRQVTLIFHNNGEEVSATVTQVEGDSTPNEEVEAMLRSIVPAAGMYAGAR